jgi:SulP family sulfate permease
MFKPHDLIVVARTGPTQAVVLAVTFALTLVIPMQYAVVIGVGISVILFVVEQSTRIRVLRWRFSDGPLPTEEKPPAVLPPAEMVVLNVSGSLFFASAALFTEQLPTVAPESSHSAVVVRLRGEQNLGSTVIQALLRYKAELDTVDGHLLITGAGTQLVAQLEATKAMDELGRDNVFVATRVVGESLLAGIARAKGLVAPYADGSNDN